jgi:hypothetical protein
MYILVLADNYVNVCRSNGTDRVKSFIIFGENITNYYWYSVKKKITFC